MSKNFFYCLVILLTSFGVSAETYNISTPAQADAFIQNIKTCNPDSIRLTFGRFIKFAMELNILAKNNNGCVLETTTAYNTKKCTYSAEQVNLLSRYIYAMANNTIEELAIEDFVKLKNGEQLDITSLYKDCIQAKRIPSEDEISTLKKVNEEMLKNKFSNPNEIDCYTPKGFYDFYGTACSVCENRELIPSEGVKINGQPEKICRLKECPKTHPFRRYDGEDCMSCDDEDAYILSQEECSACPQRQWEDEPNPVCAPKNCPPDRPVMAYYQCFFCQDNPEVNSYNLDECAKCGAEYEVRKVELPNCSSMLSPRINFYCCNKDVSVISNLKQCHHCGGQWNNETQKCEISTTPTTVPTCPKIENL